MRFKQIDHTAICPLHKLFPTTGFWTCGPEILLPGSHLLAQSLTLVSFHNIPI